MRTWWIRIAVLVVAVSLGSYSANDVLRLLESAVPSESVGTTNDGRLIHGKRLPSAGRNFRTYSRLGSALGRTAVHSRVRAAILDAYTELVETQPETRYVYGETGWPWGGRFRPHRTHQNGLSVDFMVPVRRGGQPATLPTHGFNKLGYGVEFDARGRSGSLAIDFDAIAAHLRALDDAARDHGLGIALVVFAPDLQELLFQTGLGAPLRGRLRFNVDPSWVRHDDHYHVDFRLVRP